MSSYVSIISLISDWEIRAMIGLVSMAMVLVVCLMVVKIAVKF